MITSLSGALSTIGTDWVEITVANVGLRVNVPASFIENVGEVGGRVHLFTSLQVKEDSLTLYGFPNPDGRQAFEALLGVNGVGPRLALSILSILTPENLAFAVAEEDTDVFNDVSGVGKRIAQRIVMELKGKLQVEMTAAPAARPDREIVDALTALGYSASEAMEAVAGIPSDDSMEPEEKLRLALSRLVGL